MQEKTIKKREKKTVDREQIWKKTDSESGSN